MGWEGSAIKRTIKKILLRTARKGTGHSWGIQMRKALWIEKVITTGRVQGV